MNRFNNKRSLIVLGAFFIGLCLVSAGISYAYLTSDNSIDNKFTIGKNDVELKEEFDPPEDIKPGDVIRKKVWVLNTGNTYTYVRTKILFSDGDMKQNIEPLDLGENWTYNSTDNYYYYTKAVEPNDKTTNLIEKIKIKSSANQEELKAFDVTVYVESVTNSDASSYSDAW